MLSTLLSHPTFTSVTSLTRRAPPATGDKLNAVTEDSANWPSKLSSLQPPPSVFFSALGTTRAAAGSFANQRKIDLDLNLEMAKAAKAAGTKVYVLISSGGANASSFSPYMAMKGQLEEDVKALGFDKTIILRPGLIVGDRQESRPPEAAVRFLAKGLTAISPSLTSWWAQDASVIAKAAVHAGIKALNGDRVAMEEKGQTVVIVGQSDIVRLGQTEWKDL